MCPLGSSLLVCGQTGLVATGSGNDTRSCHNIIYRAYIKPGGCIQKLCDQSLSNRSLPIQQGITVVTLIKKTQ